MDEKQKRTLTILFITINVILWPLFIFPNIGKVISSIFSTVTQNTANSMVQDTRKQEDMLNPIDFHSLRDPFLIPSSVRPQAEQVKKTTKKVETRPQPDTTPQYNVTPVEKSFVSRFKLKSIVKVNNEYYANLEEAQHYGDGGNNVPYSYRFGPDGQPVSSSSSKTYMVVQGDSVMGETVYQIRQDYVIMARNRQYFKLTFSGGFAVQNP